MATKKQQPAEQSPADFDLAAWIAGMAPAEAEYPWPGGPKIRLQAWTVTKQKEWGARAADFDSDDERTVAYIAEHVVWPELPAEALARMRETRLPEFAELGGLAFDLDNKPQSQIAPRFLPDASD